MNILMSRKEENLWQNEVQIIDWNATIVFRLEGQKWTLISGQNVCFAKYTEQERVKLNWYPMAKTLNDYRKYIRAKCEGHYNKEIRKEV